MFSIGSLLMKFWCSGDNGAGPIEHQEKTEGGKRSGSYTKCFFVWITIVVFYYNPGNCNMQKKKIFLSFSHSLAHTSSFKYPTNTLNKSGDITVDVLHIIATFCLLDTVISGFTCREASFHPDSRLWSRSHLFTFITHIPLLVLFVFLCKQLQWPPTNMHLLSMRQDLSSTYSPLTPCIHFL